MNTFSSSRQAEWQLSSPVYQHNNLTWLSLGKWVMSRALQFAVPTASLKERAVSFRDLAAFSFGLCPFLLGSAFYRVALMFLLFHSVFAFLNILSSWIVPITYWIPSSYSGLCWLLRVLINYIKIEFCLYITIFLLFFFPLRDQWHQGITAFRFKSKKELIWQASTGRGWTRHKRRVSWLWPLCLEH